MSSKVLVVDDHQDILDATTMRLQSCGYQTISSKLGRDAVPMALAENPAAILLDVRMPDQNGLITLADLKGEMQTKHIPVIMLSASVVDQQRALDAGAIFFLTKPYHSKNLLAAVGAATKSA